MNNKGPLLIIHPLIMNIKGLVYISMYSSSDKSNANKLLNMVDKQNNH